MFGSLRIDCDQHATEHREELAGIQMGVNKRKAYRRRLWIMELGYHKKHALAGRRNNHP